MLVAPLDWGLGHATRCIPVIRELMRQGAQVIIATGKAGKSILKPEFPTIEFIEIPGYPVRYKRGLWLKWGILIGIPHILRQIKKENEWLNDLLRNRKIDAIISDNRYGLFHDSCYSIFITHQLQIQSGLGNRSGWPMAFRQRIDRRILLWNYKFISKFSACWIPDEEGDFSAGGLLSHPSLPVPIPTKYIGILSRFHFLDNIPEKNTLLILISGPEPQRTEFENIIISQLGSIQMKVSIVRGLPETDQPLRFKKEGMQIFNHLPTKELSELTSRSEVIIARSGYSSIMDLITLHKKAILVPTPGQTEQEYLGQYLIKKNWMYSASQKNINIEKEIAGFQKADLVLPEFPVTNLQAVIGGLLYNIDEKSAVMTER